MWGYRKICWEKVNFGQQSFFGKYFHKILYHQTTTNRTKINELKMLLRYKYELMRPSKGIINLANLRTMFGYLFEEIEYIVNAKSSVQVSPCTTAMQKFHTSYMHSSFFCHLLICHHSINASNCSKYCN